MKIQKAVITAGGFGTRFLPATKAYQKEMIPILDKPQLQYVIEEAIASGIEQIIVTMKEGANTFLDYLEDDNKFFGRLKELGKEDVMESWLKMKNSAEILTVTQKPTDPYGNGVPFLLAHKHIKDEPFAAMWGDDIMIQMDENALTPIEQLTEYLNKYNPSAVMAIKVIKPEEMYKFGCYEVYDKTESNIPYHAKKLVEKPKEGEIKTPYANACRFIITPEIMEELETRIQGKGNEIWLTDAVSRQMLKGKTVICPPVEGWEWVPVGEPVYWLKANMLMGLQSEKYKDGISNLIKEMSTYVP